MTRDPTLSAAARVLAISIATLSLTACAGAEGLEPAPLTPTSRYSLQVEPGVERIALAVHETGLSGNQEAALADMANRFALAGAPALRVETPAGNDPVAAEAGWRVKDALERMGVPGHLIQVVGYAGPDARAPILVGFDTVSAVVPQCGTRWGDLTATANNVGFENFGCAISANLAAQIANPRDIVAPRGLTPPDAGRRSVVFDNYRKGVATSAAQEPLVDGQGASQSVQ